VKKGYWVLGSLFLLTALSATCFAGEVPISPAPLPEADPTAMIAIGVAAIGYLAAVTKYRGRK
jgi:hypothetical protein